MLPFMPKFSCLTKKYCQTDAANPILASSWETIFLNVQLNPGIIGSNHWICMLRK